MDFKMALITICWLIAYKMRRNKSHLFLQKQKHHHIAMTVFLNLSISI